MKKLIFGIVYTCFSIVWLYIAFVFVSELFSGPSHASYEWEENKGFIPFGIIMFVIWVLSFIYVIRRGKR